MKVKGKVLVITGAGSGMGRELTLRLLSRGAKVAAVDIDENSLAQTKKLWNGEPDSLLCFKLDISDKSAVNNLPALVEHGFGSVDGLINNAGIIQPFERVNDLNLEAAERVFNVNFFGSFYLIKAFLPYLIARPTAHIVNVSSMGALVPVPGQVVYGASKAAIGLLSDGLRSELAETNIRISLVVPGAVNTNITANSGVAGLSGADAAKHKTLSAEKAANIIVEGIENNKSRIIVGKDARTLDILSRISPDTAAKIINKSMANLLPPSG